MFLIFGQLLAENLIKIGYYENPPKIYSDEKGQPAGFWAEITNYIADQENWQIKWIYGKWEQCLQRLQKNEIDIMVDVGWTPQRDSLFTFCSETVHLSWTRIYRKSGSSIHSILDLKDKTIAGLKNSFDLEGPEGLKAVIDKFEISAQIIEMDTYREIFETLSSGKIDAGIVDKDFGNIHDLHYQVESTPIVLQPAKMQYAFNKKSTLSVKLAKKIDHHIRNLKQDNSSLYYDVADKYFSASEKISIIPIWIRYSMIIAFVLILFFFSFNRVLEHKIKIKTKELQEDISQRKAAEMKLKQSEENYKILNEQAADGICKIDKKGKLIQVNSAFIKMCGYSFDDLQNKSIQEIFYFNKNLPNLFFQKAKKSEILPTKLITKNGENIPVEINSKILSDDSVISIIRDVTQRKKTERENRRLAEIIRNMKEGVILTDTKGKIHYVNEAFENMCGFQQNELLGEDPAKFIITDNQTEFSEELRKAVIERGIWQGEMLCKRRNGLQYPIKTQLFPIKDDHDEIIEIAAIQEDITQQKQTQKKLESYRNDLEKMVKERTKELERKNNELEKFNHLFVGRELRIKELKDKVKYLEKKLKIDPIGEKNERR